MDSEATAELIAIEVHLAADAAATMRRDVRAGLSTEPKELAPKYFYDERGSQLFEQITELPEYYPTRAERSILAERSGSEDLTRMGGMAIRAPVLAALFLIVTLATLAMPGSANFIGEFYILNGLFDAKIVFACIAISGVAMSAYYALRLYQRTMHNRKPEGVESREIGWRDGVVLVPLVLCIVGLALYPQLILKRTDSSVQKSVAAVAPKKTVAIVRESNQVKP